MYHEFYGLRQAPFKITPDTRLFFPGGNRGEILEALVYAISSGEGIIKVVGEVGSGKTMLCRMLEVRLPKENFEIVYLPNPSLTPEDILHAIALELGIEVDPAANRVHVMQALHHVLLRRHADNKRVVVFVEEAQAMPLATLEEVRLLSNLETQQDKLLQIVLFGQPELNKNLNVRSIRQLRERITHSFGLPPLNAEDIQHYVRFRLNAVGYRGPDMFDIGAYKTIAQASRGLTRRVNILADKSLLAAFAENTHNVSRKHAVKAISDSEMKSGRIIPRPAIGLAASIAVAALAGGIYFSTAFGGFSSGETVQAAHAADAESSSSDSLASAIAATASASRSDTEVIAAATMVAEAPVASTAEIREASATDGDNMVAFASTAATAGDAPQLDKSLSNDSFKSSISALPEVEPAGVVDSDTSSTKAISFVDSATPSTDSVVAGSTPGLGSSVSVSEYDDAPESAVSGAPVEQPDTDSSLIDAAVSGTVTSVPPEPPSQAGASESTDLAMLSLGASEVDSSNLLQQRLHAARDWLSNTDSSHFTIQLLATDVSQGDSLEAFLRGWRSAGRLDRIYVYRTKIRGGVWFGVLYDDYETFSEAQEVLQRLPPEVKRYKPFIRNVRDIGNLG